MPGGVAVDRIWTTQLGEHAGERVRLAGWLHRLRRLSEISFLILRDAKGLTVTTIFKRASPCSRLSVGESL